MKTSAVILTTALLLFAPSVFALSISNAELASLSWSYSADKTDDHTGDTNVYGTFGMGHAIANGFLYVVVQTNFPIGGAVGNDSYGYNQQLNTGDLYLNIGGTFQSQTGSVYGVATTSHGNIVQQAYPGQVWTNVVAGSLYSNAVFADGTYEKYEEARPGAQPADGDGSATKNSYPTLIKTGTLAAGDVSGVLYRNNSGAFETGPWAWDIFYKVSLGSLGLLGGDSIQAFWSMECGNDGVEHVFKNTVPEPTTVALLLAGLAAMSVRKRRTA